MGRYLKTSHHLTRIEHLVEIASTSGVGRRPARENVPRVHKVQQRLEPATLAQIAADYEAGMSTQQLMAHYQLGKGTVLRLLRSQGVDIRNQSLTPQQCEEAITLYLDGWSLAKVGRHFDREHTVIRDVLVRAGIPRRDSHGRPVP